MVRSKERAFFFLFWTSSPVNRASNGHSGHSSPTKLPHRRNQPKPPLFMALEQELVVHWITPASNVTPSTVRSRHLAHRRRCTRSVCTAGDFRHRPSSTTSAVFVTDARTIVQTISLNGNQRFPNHEHQTASIKPPVNVTSR